MIIDLRGNPGGVLSSAAQVANYFAPEGLPIVSVAQGQSEKIFSLESSATGMANLNTAPIAVLVDGIAASGAEAFALALRESAGAAGGISDFWGSDGTNHATGLVLYRTQADHWHVEITAQHRFSPQRSDSRYLRVTE